MIYEAATDPSLWPTFLKSYAEAVAVDITFLQRHHFAEHRSEMLAVCGLPLQVEDAYHQYYSKLNVWRDRGERFYVQGRVFLDPEVYSRPLFETTEFYNDCLLPMGSTHSMTAVVERDGDQALVLTALRENPSGAWAKPDCQSAQYLLPHMERANAIQQKLGILQAGEILLNSIELGVVFLTAGGKAIFTNHAAETIFRSADGLMLRSGALGATEIAANASLENAVRQAVSLNFSNAVSVERKSMRRHYQVVVAPLRRRFAQFAGSPAPAAVALITDPEQQHHADPELLKKLFDLTPKEAEVASKLCAGRTMEQAAGELGMQYETVRTHLRRIFSKTGTSRQTELVILLGKLPRHTSEM
jgi:DNA-binding CsgD family transcriptional regulator